MLKEVKRPDKKKVTFTYDALGRRLTKHFSRTTTHFLRSGNVPLHEWKETFEFNYSTGLYDLGTEHSPTTWIFEAGSFVPCGKITNGKFLKKTIAILIFIKYCDFCYDKRITNLLIHNCFVPLHD